MMVNPTEFGVSPKFSDNTKFRLRKSSTLEALEETRDLSEVVFSFSATASLLRMLTIRGEADHHGPFISLLFCYVYGDWVYVTIYIYVYSNPKKYRKTIYSDFTTGSYQLLLYIYMYMYIYRYTHSPSRTHGHS